MWDNNEAEVFILEFFDERAKDTYLSNGIIVAEGRESWLFIMQ